MFSLVPANPTGIVAVNCVDGWAFWVETVVAIVECFLAKNSANVMLIDVDSRRCEKISEQVALKGAFGRRHGRSALWWHTGSLRDDLRCRLDGLEEV
jgi:hypothetical protein